jgi:hypothetical protein
MHLGHDRAGRVPAHAPLHHEDLERRHDPERVAVDELDVEPGEQRGIRRIERHVRQPEAVGAATEKVACALFEAFRVQHGARRHRPGPCSFIARTSPVATMR